MQRQLQRAGDELRPGRGRRLVVGARHQADSQDVLGPLIHRHVQWRVVHHASVHVLATVDHDRGKDARDGGGRQQRGSEIARAEDRLAPRVEVSGHDRQRQAQLLEGHEPGQGLGAVDELPHVGLRQGAGAFAAKPGHDHAERVHPEDRHRLRRHPQLAQHHHAGEGGVGRDRAPVQRPDADRDDPDRRLDARLEEALENPYLGGATRATAAQHPCASRRSERGAKYPPPRRKGTSSVPRSGRLSRLPSS